MYETKQVSTQAELKADDGAEGSLSAVFSTFGVVDSDGDILVRKAFTDGQPVPMVWSHDWSMPIGKGVIKTDAERAIFEGRFFLDTTAGKDAYQTVKSMGELQEYSWGFRILEAEPGTKDGQPIRTITKAEVFEVSPVLVGANRETYTLALKGARRRLSRGQIEGAITVLQALLGDDAAEELAEAASEIPVGDDGKAIGPLGLVDAYVAGLCDTDEESLLAERPKVSDLLEEVAAARSTLDALLKRIDEIGADNPRELFRQFRRLDGLYGPVHGRRAV